MSTINDEAEILRLIESDKWMMDILYAAKTLNLPDWWVCAGFVRSKVWDALHDFKDRTALADIDVVYYDPNDLDENNEKQLERRLHELMPNVPWSVKNEARMHLKNGLPPYTSTVDAISKFPETVTAVGVKLNEHNQLIFTAPHGIDDLINMIVKPTPLFSDSETMLNLYKERIRKKQWQIIWPYVKITRTHD